MFIYASKYLEFFVFLIIYNYYRRHIFTIIFTIPILKFAAKLLHSGDTVSPFCSLLRDNVLTCAFMYFSLPLFSLFELDTILLAEVLHCTWWQQLIMRTDPHLF